MKKKSLLLVLALICVATFSCGFMAFAAARDVSEPSLYEETYELGETITVRSHDVTVNGSSVSTKAYVIYPDGRSVTSDTVKLSDVGVYVVEYRAIVGGKVYKEQYKFRVDYPKYTVTSKSDEVAYKTVTVGDASVDGLYVKIASGSTFACNQAIDLTKLNSGDNLISFFIVPDAVGAVDCNYFYLQISDALDSSNYITIKIRKSPWGEVAYVMAKAHNQSTWCGVEKGQKGDEPETSGNFGFAADASFTGAYFGKNGYKMQLSYDNDTQTLYMENNTYSGGGNYVINFNDSCFAEGWDGFKSGKVVISAYASEYLKRNMGFVITSLAQVDLEEADLSITEPSGVNVDYGDYTSEDYPHAVVGKPYRIFDAAPISLYTTEKVYVSVKTSYGSSSAINVEVKDGCFTPSRAIVHTIVYTCVDGFGNTKEYTVPVTVDSGYDEVDFELNTSPVTVDIGSTIEIPEATALTGGNGKLKVKIELKKNGASSGVEITESTYRFIEEGDFVLAYTVSDYNNCTAEKQISVKVNPSSGPLFNQTPELPMRIIKGGKYAVPSLVAEDFSSGTLQTVAATAEVYVDGSAVEVTDGYFVANGSGKVKIVYTAVDAKNRSSKTEFEIPIVDVGFNGTLDLTKYFVTSNGSVSAVDKALALTGKSGSDASFTFIRELNGRVFNAEFGMKKAQTGYKSVEFVLAASADEAKNVKIAITSDGGYAAISVNGGKAVKTDYLFSGDVKNYQMQLDGNTLFLCNTYITVKTYSDGSDFAGFDKFVYFTVNLKQCQGTSVLTLNSLNSQSMNNTYGRDSMAPNVMYLGSQASGSAEINSVFTISPVIAADVLDPYATITFSVKLPNKEYATAEDGTVLKKVSAEKLYKIKIDAYGSYIFSYSYQDSKGNGDDFTTIVTCADKIAPVITVGKNEASAKVGDSLSLPSYTVKDNYSKDDKVTVQIQIITPEGVYVTYNSAKGYVFEKAGTYYVRIFVFDENYNIALTDVTYKVSK